MTALRVAVLAESETDDAVAREIVAHVRSAIVVPVAVPSLRARGWPAVLRQLPQVVRTLHYQREADALVVLADADATVPHDPSTRTLAAPDLRCRWCLLELMATRTALGPRPASAPLLTAIGTPVPAVEAWLLAGRPPHPSEAAWRQRGAAAAAASVAYKRQLKQDAYGLVPSADTAGEATRLVRSALATTGLLRAAFPGGYGPLEDAISSW